MLLWKSFRRKSFFFSFFPDVDVPSPDEKSVITYVSSIYDAFPKVPEGGEGISATVSFATFVQPFCFSAASFLCCFQVNDVTVYL